MTNRARSGILKPSKEKENKTMMKIYKVELETLTYDWGRHEGWELIGYYVNKDKANKIAENAYKNRNKVVQGEVRITEVNIEE